MKAVAFVEQNTVYAADQPEYLDLPALRFADGVVVTQWRPSLREKLALLLGRPLWLAVLTFNQPLQPLSMSVGKPPIDLGGSNE